MKNGIHGRKILRLILSLATISALAACTAVPIEAPVTGYTCCNLHSYEGWISSDNLQGGDLVAAGESARFDEIKKNYYLYGNIGGIDMALRHDNARSKEDTLNWARRIIVAENPRPRLASWTPEIQKAVQYGRVMVGMTKEQVLMSLGYPSSVGTFDVSSDEWRYWTALGNQPVDLKFGMDQKLASISGIPSAVRQIEALR